MILYLLIVVLLYVIFILFRRRCVSRLKYGEAARVLYDELNVKSMFVRAKNEKDNEIKLNSPNEVIPGLFIGSYSDANESVFRELHINSVVNLVSGFRFKFEEDCKNDNIITNRLDLSVLDSPFYNIAQHFDETFDFIESNLQRGNRVLVYCHAGISRSATIVAMYLQRAYGWNTTKTLFYLRSVRPIVLPNEGFIRQLLEDCELYNRRR